MNGGTPRGRSELSWVKSVLPWGIVGWGFERLIGRLGQGSGKYWVENFVNEDGKIGKMMRGLDRN